LKNRKKKKIQKNLSFGFSINISVQGCLVGGELRKSTRVDMRPAT